MHFFANCLSIMLEQLTLLLIYIGILIYIIKRKKSVVSLYVVLVWIIVILAGFLYRNSSIYYEGKHSMTLFPYLFLAICFLIYIRPLFEVNIRKLLNMQASYYFCLFLNICAFIAVLPFFENIVHTIQTSQNVSVFADLYASKDEINFDGRNHLSFIGSKLNSITLILQNISPLLFIYYITWKRINKFTAIGLLLCALNPIVFMFALGSRGVAVIILLWSIALFLLLKGHIPYNRKKIMSTTFVILGAFIGGIIALITISRFSESEFEISEWIVRYIGESTIGYNEEVFYTKNYTYGENSFSFFRYILELNKSPERNIPFLERLTGCRMFVFYTFVGDLVIDFGPIITIVFLLILSIYMSNLIRRNSTPTKLSTLIILGLYIKMGIIGYMFMFTKLGAQYILFAIFITIALGVYERKLKYKGNN